MRERDDIRGMLCCGGVQFTGKGLARCSATFDCRVVKF
jgi:hypothetical protein